MKKVITSIITAILPLFALLSSAKAQEPNAIAANSKPALPASSTTIGSAASNPSANSLKSAKDLKKEARETKQFNRISRRFVDNFEDATDIAWTKQKEGYSGSFTRDGLRNVVWYNQQGDITHLLVTYNAQRMPQDIKRLVTKAYKGYEITCVNEIHQDDILVYLVTLENDSQIKQVTVCEGEMNLYREYKKAS